MKIASHVGADSASIPIMRPQLPLAQALLPYLKCIDQARFYSNHGPLALEFAERLALRFAGPAKVTTVSNATTALTAALLASGAKPGSTCLLPSWTFVASAAAVWAAGMLPHFVDISNETWMLDPTELRNRKDLKTTGAVMPVSAFGAPVDVAAWDAFSLETGIPVVIDGAAAFDTIASVPSAAPGRSLNVVSLHATKVLGTGEGAFVVSTSEELVSRVRQICSFGSLAKPEDQMLGYNGKMSEYHAAVGLAALDEWGTRRMQLAELTAMYTKCLAGIDDVRLLPQFGAGWVSCYCNIETSRDALELVASLAEKGIESRSWWGKGVHTQPAYKAFSRDALPVTEHLAPRVIALPFFHDLSDELVERVSKAICG